MQNDFTWNIMRIYNKNYDVKTNSYSKTQASFGINGYVNNTYSKILMNSMNLNKITFTIYYLRALIDPF